MNEVLSREYTADVKSLFQIVTHSIYKDRQIFLRELISNASDACEKMYFESQRNESMISRNRSDFKILVTLDNKNRQIIIQDNGIGMTEQEMIANLGTIANSGTKKFLEEIGRGNNSLIGQFGIGFYSSFLVSDNVIVDSKKDGKACRWESTGMDGFKISETELDFEHGTKLTLNIKEDAEEYLDKHKIRNLIDLYSRNIDFDISFSEISEEVSEEKLELMNADKALWSRDKSSITSEDYSKFFRENGGIYGEPWMTLHQRVEGQNCYTYLLFVPAMKPFAMFDPDRKTSLKLYVNKVFITEDVDLIPKYLRFVKGIVDSSDLPLNVSREVVQTSHLITQIKQYLTKKIINELKLSANSKTEEYRNVFWQNFGPVLKEGLCEPLNTEQRESIMEICRFYTTKSQFEPISLAEYVERMPSEQKEIFYLTGNSVEKMLKSPEIEGFLKRDIEVLLLTDSVDDFWITVVLDYKNVKFRSISQNNLILNDIKTIERNDQDSHEEVTDEQMEKLIATVKDVLGKIVQDVVISNKLVESPACLGLKEGQMNSKLERFLIEQKQLADKTQKILELNKDHTVIKKMNRLLEEEGPTDNLKDAIKNLFDFVCIIAEEPLNDSIDFSMRASKIINNIL